MKGLLAALLVVAAAACGWAPRLGEACSGQKYICDGPSRALECKSGHWGAIECRGPGGCTRAASAVTCDLGRAQEGDRCRSDSEGLADCGTDGHSLWICRSGRMVLEKGCDHCEVLNGSVSCR